MYSYPILIKRYLDVIYKFTIVKLFKNTSKLISCEFDLGAPKYLASYSE